MTETDYRVPSHSVAGTIIILILGAELGALWGLVLAFVGSVAMTAAGGPLALLIAAPLLFAVYGVGTMYVVFGAPLWAFLGGSWFAVESSGDTGFAAKEMGVTFFPESHPIAQTAQRMAQELGLPPIRYVGWYNADEINAFAMGVAQDNALVAVSKGAVEKLSRAQLDAVIGHELGHVASNDMSRMTWARGIREALTCFLFFRGLKKLARWVFTPLSELELLRFSRAREFTADATAAHLTSAEAMISALKALDVRQAETKDDDFAMVKMAALGDSSWFSTHPPLQARIEALEALPAQSPAPETALQETALPLYVIPG